MKKPKVIAHRGGRKWAPENTMAAFRKSLDLGVDGIELDVHRCASGELVVIHDEDLRRTTDGVGLVKDATLPELRRLSAGEWFSEDFADERIPLLQEVLELIDGTTVLNIELKNTPVDYPDIEDDLLDLLSTYKAMDKIIVSSFDHKLMYRLHDKAPEINIALLAACQFYDLKNYAQKLGATYFHPAFDCIVGDAVAEAQAAGMEVNAWTLNEKREWREATTFGVDGIVTDDPAGLKEWLT